MTKRKPVPSSQQPSTPPRQRGKGRIWPQHKLEAVLEHLRGEKSVAEICQARGISQSTFFAWKDHVLAGALEYLTHGGMSTGERQGAEPRQGPFVAQAGRQRRVRYGATAVARALRVRRQRLYAQPVRRRSGIRLRAEDAALAKTIRSILDVEPTFGYRRVTARLRRTQRINRKRVYRVMRLKGYRSNAYQGRRGHRRHRLPMATIIHAPRPNRLWGMDHTSFWAGDRLAYILVVTDHCDRDVPGYRLTVTPPTAQVAVDALEMAVAERRGEFLGELEIRTDGGPQFTADAFGRAVSREGLRQTVTPARSPQHTPFAEAFLGAFKEECVYQRHWETADEALRDAEAWIAHYRSHREQHALGGMAPLEYQEKLLRQIAA